MSDDKNGSKEEQDRFCLGPIQGVHGLDGTLKVRAESHSDALLKVKHVEIETKQGDRIKANVSSIKFRGDMLTVRLKEYQDRTAVEPLMGAIIYTQRAELGTLEEEEYWVRDLIGLDVFSAAGVKLGTVYDVIPGANQLLEIQQPGKKDTALVPFVKALVPTVDMKARRVVIADLPGLLDPEDSVAE